MPRKFPAWRLPASDGRTIGSKDLAGTPYVLYFYPKDLTPGCTTEACDFNNELSGFAELGVEVFGVSPDPLARHEKFIAKHDLGFVLLSDEDHAVAEKLAVWGPKKFMGREFDGIRRSTFLVGADGKLIQEWRNVKVKNHVAEVLAAARETVR